MTMTEPRYADLVLREDKEPDRIVAEQKCVACGQPIGFGRPYRIRTIDGKKSGIERRHKDCAILGAKE